MFTIRFRWLVVLCAVASCVIASTGEAATAADRLGANDRQAIERTIGLQLDAFARDDADGAFSFATPEIRRQFVSSANFLQMVRDQYEPVYRAVSVQFVRLESVDGQWIQTVQLVDGEGRVWRALFTMKRQADKTWKIGGCQLVQTRALST